MVSLNYLGLNEDGNIEEKSSEVFGASGGITGNLKKIEIAEGNVQVTQSYRWPTAANMFTCVIPEDDNAPDYLLLDRGKPVNTFDEYIPIIWIDRNKLLNIAEAQFDTQSVSQQRYFIPHLFSGNTHGYAGWTTDPNDSSQKLLLITTTRSDRDLLDAKICKLVVEQEGSSASVINTAKQTILSSYNINDLSYYLTFNTITAPDGTSGNAVWGSEGEYDFYLFVNKKEGKVVWLEPASLVAIGTASNGDIISNSNDDEALFFEVPNAHILQRFGCSSARLLIMKYYWQVLRQVLQDGISIEVEIRGIKFNTLSSANLTVQNNVIEQTTLGTYPHNNTEGLDRLHLVPAPGDDLNTGNSANWGSEGDYDFYLMIDKKEGGSFWINPSSVFTLNNSTDEQDFGDDRSLYLDIYFSDDFEFRIYLGKTSSNQILLSRSNYSVQDIEIRGIKFNTTTITDTPSDTQQQSITELGTRTYSALLWQKSALNIPLFPPEDWWDSQSGITDSIGLWHHTRLEALNAIAGTDPVRFAIDRVNVSPEDIKTYNGWEIFTEFGVEYSEDGLSWHSGPQQDTDKYFGFLTPDGNRRVIEIKPTDLSWTRLYQNYAYQREHGTSTSIDFGGTINLNLYQRLRFTWLPFGYWTGDQPNKLGAEITAYLNKPIETGWVSSPNDNNTDEERTGSWFFDDVTGGSVIMHGERSRDSIELPPAKIRTGTSSLPPRSLSGKFKFIRNSSDEPYMVKKIRNYGFVSGASYRRFKLTIDGATY